MSTSIAKEFLDNRYHIGLEFTGALTQQWVVRFCGDFVTSKPTEDEASQAALIHATQGLHTIYELLTLVNNVMWLKSKTLHKVCYGASVKVFNGKDRDLEAAKEFGFCVRHSLECDGLLD